MRAARARGCPAASAARSPRRSPRKKDARPCRADAGALRSRASRPARARRTQAAPSRSRASAPGDDAAAEAEPPRAQVANAGVPPELEQQRLGIPLVEAANARPEEVSDLGPARREQPSRERQAGTDVRLPERPPDSARECELEPGDRAAGAHDACELAQRRSRIVHVPEQVREGERVERRVRKRQLLRAPLDERHARWESTLRLGE